MAEQGAMMHGLEFLIATDAELHKELSAMCDLLDTLHGSDSSSSSATTAATSSLVEAALDDFASPAPTKRKAETDLVRAKNKFQFKQRQEILQLRTDVTALQARLHELKAKGDAALPPTTMWATIAKQELLTKTEALQENAHLRGEVDRQVTFVDAMLTLLRKRPLPQTDVHNSHMADWKQYKLAAAQHLRTAAIHAIADREYSRQQTAFLNAGLYPISGAIDYRAEARTEPNGSVTAKFIVRDTYDAPMDVVADAFWRVFTGEKVVPVAIGATHTIERIDNDTVYQKYHASVGGIPIHLNVIAKRIREPSRRLIVWRSVLEDALQPHLSVGVTGVQWGWTTVEVGSNGSVDFTFLCHVNTCRAESVDDVRAKIREFRFCEKEAVTDLPWDEMRRSPMEVFMERGRRWENAFRESIADSVNAYHAARRQA
ncbi:hypothetical protein SPRG_08683 [Saprolegnia parasitica CBS 223.65]|uniref:START domain-containing protein n=1 Tax=Saprolegnia parasitica (strain CBS 223.65) TaxID=695850 RepID=A0A067CA27_SAPPC|nr:hypothetical protein SPRG_08683 [Saprolegnia parasitica CBS 223.65]KDO26030.1 hypothetical protein SPRG_08683 [Saprolegnia parasitica CBS 223.65]|eukprot:XP_012203316.1 hypothetical protein SPRG_08683 [Saprolegnia parasitica CBS 223.65]